MTLIYTLKLPNTSIKKNTHAGIGSTSFIFAKNMNKFEPDANAYSLFLGLVRQIRKGSGVVLVASTLKKIIVKSH